MLKILIKHLALHFTSVDYSRECDQIALNGKLFDVPYRITRFTVWHRVEQFEIRLEQFMTTASATILHHLQPTPDWIAFLSFNQSSFNTKGPRPSNSYGESKAGTIILRRFL